jgi:4-alpha-glucanotransferase
VSFLRRQGLLGKGGRAKVVLRALLLSLASSPAGFVQINVEDLWLERSAQNVPGTTDEHPNWRRRARFRLEEWNKVPGLVRLLEQISRARAS